MAIKTLKNEIEEPWCFSESLAPVKNVCLAILLLLFNIFVPGLGTILSGFFVGPIKSKDKSTDQKPAA